MREHKRNLDLIEMSMVDTFAATVAGAFSLSEMILSVKAGRFFSQPCVNGLFTVSRWRSPTATVEIGRVVSLAIAALMEFGAQNMPKTHLCRRDQQPRDHLVSRQPFPATDLDALDEATTKLRFDVLASPARPAADKVLAVCWPHVRRMI